MTQIIVKQADFTQNSYVGRIVQEDMYGLPLMYDVRNGLYFISKTCEAVYLKDVLSQNTYDDVKNRMDKLENTYILDGMNKISVDLDIENVEPSAQEVVIQPI